MALFGSASLAYFNKLGGRFLLPLYLPLMTLPVLAAAAILASADRSASAVLRGGARVICTLALAVLAASPRVTYPLVRVAQPCALAGERSTTGRKDGTL
jgi:hypothetical protein